MAADTLTDAEADRLRVLVAEGDRYGARWVPNGTDEIRDAGRMLTAGWVFPRRGRGGALGYFATLAGREALARHEEARDVR